MTYKRTKILLNNIWRLKDSSGNTLQQSITFYENGTIGGSSHTNESFWEINNNILYIYNEDMHLVSVFDEIFNLGNGFYQFLGNWSSNIYLNDNKSMRRDVILESFSNSEKEIKLSEFAIEAKLGKKTNKLLIQINSVASVFDGNNHKREFNYLTNILGIDIIRVSQSRPLYWYSNILSELEHVLSGCINVGYKQVFILGSSAGGYAALMLGERLSTRFIEIKFTTYTINPQTTLEKSIIDDILNKYDHHFIHEDIIEHNLLVESQIMNTGVSEALRVLKQNIVHHVCYDALNPVEAHYCAFLKNSPRVLMYEYNFGLSHGEGCVKIGDSQTFKNLFLTSIIDRII